MKTANGDVRKLVGDNVTAMERKFINMYRKQKLLWDPHHPDYYNKVKRNVAYDALLPIFRQIMPNATRFHVRRKINILRVGYRKDLFRHLASRTVTEEGNVVYTFIPTFWKFQALNFLNFDKKSEEDSNSCEAEHSSTEEDTCPENEEEEPEIELPSDPHLNGSNDKTCTLSTPGSTIYIKDENPNNHRNSHKNNYSCEENILEQEYNAISSNVTCKLQRMKPQQRYHAELLINKVLIYGLNDRLTDDTNLTDVWRFDSTSINNNSSRDGDNLLIQLLLK